MKKALLIIGTSVLAVVAIGYYLLVGGGAPVSTNLALVGQGKPSFVLAYENYSPTGGEALNRLRKVRSDYDERINFIVADIGTPEGRAFSERYQLSDGIALFLSAEGEPLEATDIAVDESELRSRLDAKLLLVE